MPPPITATLSPRPPSGTERPGASYFRAPLVTSKRRSAGPVVCWLAPKVTQELLNNAIKNARARQGRISDGQEPKPMLIRAPCNGMGFVTGTPYSYGSIGQTSLRNRVEQLGGTHTINMAPGPRTAVAIRTPPYRTGHRPSG